jgi:hypothetical protein
VGADNYTPLQQPAGGYAAPGGSAGYGPSQSPRPPQPGQRTTRDQWIAKAANEFITYKRQVPGRLTDYDAKQLNLQVTSSYAKMYLTKPSIFKWAGMAAFASKEVGNGMAQAWELGFGAGADMFTPAAVWVGGILTGRGGNAGPMMGKLLFWALSGGNRIVWYDIFWQHVAYRDSGIKTLEDAHQAGEIPEASFAAWSIIDSAVKKNEIENVWMGNALLLKYEQQEVLQPQIYDAKEVKELWPAISPDVPTPIPGHGVNFTSYVPGGNIGNFTDRWKWIFESMLPAWQALETNEPARTKKLIGAMR